MTHNNPNQKFDSLYAQYQAKTRQVMAKVLRDRDLVDEAQQILWLKVWQKVQVGEHITDANSYLCQAARNEALQLRRDRACDSAKATSFTELQNAEESADKQDPRLDPAEPEDPECQMDPGLKSALGRAVDLLPRRESEVVSLYYWGKMTTPRISARLGISLSATTMALSRGMNTLRGQFTRGQKEAA